VIARHWRGLARANRADEYERHLLTETFPALQRMDGFVDASILKRTVEQGVEFLVVTRWQSLGDSTFCRRRRGSGGGAGRRSADDGGL
jgi:hypothetical protein